MENVGVKLVRQAGAKTSDLAGDGSTTSVVLAHGLIAEGLKVRTACCRTLDSLLSQESARFGGLRTNTSCMPHCHYG